MNKDKAEPSSSELPEFELHDFASSDDDEEFQSVVHRYGERPVSPYPGLRPFEQSEYNIFRGRDQQRDDVIERLNHSNFVSVIGPSGCGKSSLIRASVVPALEFGMIYRAGSSWRTVTMRPGNSPFFELSKACLRDLDGIREPDPEEIYNHGRQFFGSAAENVSTLKNFAQKNGELNLLVVVDQFEELFRYETEAEAEEVSKFVDFLIYVYRNSPDQLFIILTMRTDHLADCVRLPGLAEVINRTFFLTPNMKDDQLERAIIEPAEEYGGTIGDDLVKHILNDVHSLDVTAQGDYLPLMQHALMRMWHLATSDTNDSIELTQEHYEKVGRVTGSLSKHAEDTLLDAKEQIDVSVAGQNKIVDGFVKVLFQSLTERRRGQHQQDVRRPVKLREILDVWRYDSPDSIQLARRIIDVYRRGDVAFIRPFLPEELNDETVLDITHESLIRQWRELRKWVEEESRNARRILTLHDYASSNAALLDNLGTRTYETWWHQGDPHPTSNWARRYGLSESQFEAAHTYLKACIERIRSQEKEDEDRKLKAIEEKEQQKRRDLKHQFAIYSLLAVVLVIGVGAWLLDRQSSNQEKELAENTVSNDFKRSVAHAATLIRGEKPYRPGIKRRIDEALEVRYADNSHHSKIFNVTYSRKSDELADILKSYVDHVQTDVQIFSYPHLANKNEGRVNFSRINKSVILPFSNTDKEAFAIDPTVERMVATIGFCGEATVFLGRRDYLLQNSFSTIDSDISEKCHRQWQNAQFDGNPQIENDIALRQDRQNLVTISIDGQLRIWSYSIAEGAIEVREATQSQNLRDGLENLFANPKSLQTTRFGAALSRDGDFAISVHILDSASPSEPAKVVLRGWGLHSKSEDSIQIQKEFEYVLLNESGAELGSLTNITLGGKNNDRIAASFTNRHLYFFDIERNDDTGEIKVKESVEPDIGIPRVLTFSSYEDVLFLGRDREVEVWVRTMGEEAESSYVRHNTPFIEGKTRISAIHGLPNGRVAVGNSAGNLMVWHYRDGAFLEHLLSDNESSKNNPAVSITSHINGELVRLNGDWSAHGYRLDRERIEPQPSIIPLKSEPYAVALNPADPEKVAVGYKGLVELHDQLANSTNDIEPARENPQQLVWDGASGSGSIGPVVTAMDFSNDGRFLAAGGRTANEGGVAVWDLRDENRIEDYEFDGDIIHVEFLPKNGGLAVVSEKGALYMISAADLINREKTLPRTLIRNNACFIAIDPAGVYLAVGTRNGDVEIRDQQDMSKIIGKLIEHDSIFKHLGKPYLQDLRFSSDGRNLLSVFNGQKLTNSDQRKEEARTIECGRERRVASDGTYEGTNRSIVIVHNGLQRFIEGAELEPTIINQLPENWITNKAKFLPSGNQILVSDTMGDVNVIESVTGNPLTQYLSNIYAYPNRNIDFRSSDFDVECFADPAQKGKDVCWTVIPLMDVSKLLIQKLN